MWDLGAFPDKNESLVSGIDNRQSSLHSPALLSLQQPSFSIKLSTGIPFAADLPGMIRQHLSVSL